VHIIRKVIALIACIGLSFTYSVHAEDYLGDGIISPGENEMEELARAVQNPLASMISLPFQLNTNFDAGPLEKTQHILNIQPVVPFELNEDWNFVTRTIIPVISQPAFTPNQDRKEGLGDSSVSGWFTPRETGDWIWGVGPSVLVPTSTDDRLGAGEWAAGGSVIVLTMRGPWVAGSLFNNVWDVTGDDDINFLTWQYFTNYNFDDGWYLGTHPIITANWEADSDNTWTIPVGGGIGRVFRIGNQPVNSIAHAYYNVEKPDHGADWQLRLQIQFLFPQ
jgi:hypothetical protein